MNDLPKSTQEHQDRLAAGPTERVRAAHVLKALSQSLSTDGTTAMLVFEIAVETGVERFALTMPVDRVRLVQGMLGEVKAMMDRRNVGPGMVAFRPVREAQIGHSDHVRNHVSLLINQHSADEVVLLMEDELALDVANGLQKNVFGRMSNAQRQAWVRKHHAASTGLAMPGERRLILPGLPQS